MDDSYRLTTNFKAFLKYVLPRILTDKEDVYYYQQVFEEELCKYGKPYAYIFYHFLAFFHVQRDLSEMAVAAGLLVGISNLFSNASKKISTSIFRNFISFLQCILNEAQNEEIVNQFKMLSSLAWGLSVPCCDEYSEDSIFYAIQRL